MKNSPVHPQQGFALILALIISSVVLSIGLSMLNITMKELDLGATARQSEIAFQGADAGLNCLEYVRNKYPIDTRIQQNVQFSCLGKTITLTDDATAAGVQHYRVKTGTNFGFNWKPTGATDDLCIDIEMYVLDASNNNISYAINGNSRSCSRGSVCTFGFSRSYNQACGTTGGTYTVERELTAEF